MTVRRILTIVAALIAVLVAGGCGDRGNDPVAAETDDPFFVQGRQLQRQGRNPEALTAFLKVIEKRGERAAAESHLEAGQIYLNHTKDPVEAYHHFRKYLELQPNSKQAELVRGMVKAALREFARTIPGRPLEDQSMRLQADDEILKLRRENDEMRAELSVLRGGGATPVRRSAATINLPVETRAVADPVPTLPVADSPVTRAPARVSGTPNVPSPVVPAPRAAVPAAAIRNSGVSPARGVPPGPGRATLAASGTVHTVVAKDTLFSLSKKYGVRMEDLAAANGLPSIAAPLKLGTVLRIPSAGGSR